MTNAALDPCFYPSPILRPLHELKPHGDYNSHNAQVIVRGAPNPGPWAVTDCFPDYPTRDWGTISPVPQAPLQFPSGTQVQVNVNHYGVSPVRNFYPDEVRIGNVGELLIGGFTGHKTGDAFADVISKFKTDGVKWTNIKALGSASLKAGGMSAGLSAAASAWQNIGAASKGLITTRDAIGNVAADTVGGLMSGTSAGLGAGAATLALRSFGVAGLPLTIGAAAAGALGGIGGSKLFDVTGLRSRVFDAVRTLIR